MDIFDKLVCLNIILIIFFFSIILTDSVFAIDKNYYPKVFLEEYKDLVQERKLAKIMSS